MLRSWCWSWCWAALLCVLLGPGPADGHEWSHVLPNHTSLKYEGRYAWNQSSNINAVSFDMPGFRISFCVTGAQNVSVLLSSIGLESPHRFWIYVNDTLLEENTIDTADAELDIIYSYPVATSLNNESVYCLTLIKISESNFNSAYKDQINYVQFHGIELIGVGGDLTSPLQPLHGSPRRKIEFIGDSIMAGYMNLCGEENAGDLGDLGAYALESFALAWPLLVAESFDAEYHAIGACVVLHA